MKLLFVNMSLDPINGGGTAERTIQLFKHISAEGVECKILATSSGLSLDAVTELQSKEANIILLPVLNKRFYLPSLRLNVIKQLVADADIVHLMGHWTLINFIVYFYIKKLKKQYAVCPAGALPVFGRSKILKLLYNHIVGRVLVKNANFHIGIADNEISHFSNYGIKPDQVTVIPNGVNPADYQIDPKVDFRKYAGLNDFPYILFMGRLNSIKGPDLLLHAFSRIISEFPNVSLVFAGPDNGLLCELKQVTSQCKLESHVRFVGHLDNRMKVAAYSSALFFVVPSRQEAMSIVALEAGVCGIPVLMTDQCGFGVLTDIGGGMIVSANIEAIASGLSNFLNHSNEELKIMGQSFKSHILNNYTWKVAAVAHLELFQNNAG